MQDWERQELKMWSSRCYWQRSAQGEREGGTHLVRKSVMTITIFSKLLRLLKRFGLLCFIMWDIHCFPFCICSPLCT